MRRELLVFPWIALIALGPACKKEKEEVVEAPAETIPSEPAQYVGSEACTSCHQAEHQAWLGSHHDLAMQQATEETVLGNFNGAKAKYYKETARFVRDGDAFAVEALAADGKRARFPVIYTFGVEPLQQYLVEVEPGRLQAFPFAWDTRPKERGGQRWFHLQPEEYIEPGDALHWTAPSYNWNHACADCHSTAVKKNYDRSAKRYATEYFEIDVGCEACHGAGSKHVEIEETKGKRRAPDTGFARRLPHPSKRKWSFVEDGDIAVLATSQPSDEVEVCAPCHSRRADLGGEHARYHDRYRLAVLDELLYFSDGQIKDEVYVYGSFLQSKMYAAGVVCSDCHDGHSGHLWAEGNALCTRCHKAEVFDVPEHHFHPVGGEGSSCIDCHMPQRTYMVIDDRGDHRFGLPRPSLSARIGAPDVCTGCHTEKNAQWAEQHIAKHFNKRADHGFAEALHLARNQQPGAEQALVEIIAAGSAPAIVRATAISELRNLRSRALPAMLMRAAHDPSPIVRRTVAVSARGLPPEHRPEVVRSMLRDPIRTVRIEAVTTLLGSDTRSWRAADRKAFDRAKAEYVEARSFNADRGEGLVDLAHLATLERDPKHAEEILLEAIAVDPTFTAAYVNLADLYRSMQRDEESEAILVEALDAAADRATVEYALGLALVRLGRHDEALIHLRKAHQLRPEHVRFGYVLAVAQFDQGQRSAALRTLERLQKRYPANAEVLTLLINYNRQLGRDEVAKRYAAELAKVAP